MTGKRDDAQWPIDPQASQLPSDRESIGIRHIEIEQDRVRIHLLTQWDDIGAIRARMHVEPFEREQFGNRFPNQVIVIGVNDGKSTRLHARTVADRRSRKQPRPYEGSAL